MNLVSLGGNYFAGHIFPADIKKSFRIFAISVGFCLHSPGIVEVKLGWVEVTLVFPGNRVLMSFHVFVLSFFAIKNWDL